MIRYTLKCADGHTFDSWFQSAAAYDKLAAAGHVACAICGGSNVSKSMMAPRVSTGDAAGPSRAEVPQSDPQPGALSAPHSEAEQLIARMRDHLEKNSDYVGTDFASQARAMHDGDAPERAIHGEARPDEARKLIEDGVPVAPLPFLPTRKTN
ncbi:MAG: DUF1178 family protein [Marinibacterium sp.]|nr:DUF1178 family protein [Marinibacterium sp.]